MAIEGTSAIRFGIGGNGSSGARPADTEPQEKQTTQNYELTKEEETKNRDDFYQLQDAQGMYNQAAINLGKDRFQAIITKFNTPEQISSIENAMVDKFENGVNYISEVIRSELPNLSEAELNALAAQVFERLYEAQE